MNNPFSKKKPLPTKLGPTKRLILVVWTCVVVVFTFIFFRRFGARTLMAALILVPLIVGVLMGLRFMDKFDELAKKFGFAPKPPPPGQNPESSGKQFDAFLTFLRRHQSRGQFTRTELRKFCESNGLKEETMIHLGQKKGWFSEMGGAFVISSEGEAMLRKFV